MRRARDEEPNTTWFTEALLHIFEATARRYHRRLEMAGLVRRFKPLFDRVLVQRLVADTKTKGGVLLPEKSVGKMMEATVVAIGDGARDRDGQIVPVAVNVGDKVLLPEYGGTKVEFDEEEYYIFRDQDLLGKFNN